MKIEILEKAAEEWIKGFGGLSNSKQSFIEGAKWQAERMFSEEEVYELMIKAFNAGFNKYESVEAGLEGKEADLECANILTKYVKTEIK